MKAQIENFEIYYNQSGNKNGIKVVLLHGWKQNKEMMDPIAKRLEADFFITNIDLPGFGESSPLEKDLTIPEYVDIVKLFLQKLKIDNPIIIGHSFGGEIGLVYAARYKVSKLVLIATPFRPMKKNNTFKIKFLKSLKKIPILKNFEEPIKKRMGSTEYKNASPIMRRTLVNSVNYDATEEAKRINCPTLLVWGSADTTVFVEEAEYLETIINDAGLVVYEGCTHYAYLEKKEELAKVLKEFFK